MQTYVLQCIVCKEEKPKYKCPKCESRYCSIMCFKKHKEALCEDICRRQQQSAENVDDPSAKRARLGGEAREKEKDDMDEELEESDILSISKLRLLRNSPPILACLRNPHLCRLLESIGKAADPTQAMKAAMTIPIFTEFVDACLAVFGADIVDKEAMNRCVRK